MDTLFLVTKLRIPPHPQRAVRRVRLIDALERTIPDYKLILLAAPAGYGKTTLLTQWAHTSRFPLAWLSLSPEDNDLERFLRYMLAAKRYSQVSGKARLACSSRAWRRIAKRSYRRSSTSPTTCPTRWCLCSMTTT